MVKAKMVELSTQAAAAGPIDVRPSISKKLQNAKFSKSDKSLPIGNATDIGSTYVHWMHNRLSKSSRPRAFEAERQTLSYVFNILPPAARKGRAQDTIPAKHLHTSYNKVRHPVNVVKWTPEGRRLLTGSTSGEFTLWNGTGFNFETIMQAHDTAVRAVTYAHNNEWLISADQEGVVKYWQTNFNNVKEIQAHADPVRDLSFAPTDAKFVTASDDASLKIFDFAGGVEEATLAGHQWDAKSVDWHPTKGLIVSGSKDHQVKLWDPRTGRCLTTLHGHKNTVNMTKFEPSKGVLLASCARDQTVRVFDIRMMRDVFLLKGHEKEISSIVWHPIHSSLLTTGGADGAMFHYLLDEQNAPAGTPLTTSPYDAASPGEAVAQTIFPAQKIPFAHEYNVWCMDWHPLGHILASGSNDRATRFWTRPRPGEDTYIIDKWHIGQTAAEEKGTWRKSEAQRAREEEDADAEDDDGIEDQKMPSRGHFLPGLPGLPGLAAPGIPAPPVFMPDHSSAQNFGGNFPAPPPSFPGGNFPAPPPSFPGGMPPLPPGMDLETLRQAFGGQMPPLPSNGVMPPFPLPPAGFPPLPAGFVPPPGFPPPSSLFPGAALPIMPASGGGFNPADATLDAKRRRAPLPSQQDSLKEEMKLGRYVKPR
jgi:polyadenylation factor subunit 2